MGRGGRENSAEEIFGGKKGILFRSIERIPVEESEFDQKTFDFVEGELNFGEEVPPSMNKIHSKVEEAALQIIENGFFLGDSPYQVRGAPGLETDFTLAGVLMNEQTLLLEAPVFAQEDATESLHPERRLDFVIIDLEVVHCQYCQARLGRRAIGDKH